MAFGPKPKPLAERLWPKVNKNGPNGCWEWMAGGDQHGYGQIGYGGGNRHVKAHRAAWFLTYGVWPALHVLHSCDNPKCVNPEHLFLGTQADNHDDMKAKKRGNIGERHGHAKLTEAQAKEILSSCETGYRLAKRFGVSMPTVYDVRNRKTWRHIEGA